MEAIDTLSKAGRNNRVADVTDHSANDLTRQQLVLHSHKKCQTPFITSGSILIAATLRSNWRKKHHDILTHQQLDGYDCLRLLRAFRSGTDNRWVQPDVEGDGVAAPPGGVRHLDNRLRDPVLHFRNSSDLILDACNFL